MKNIALTLIIFFFISTSGQNTKEYTPNEIRELKTDFTEEFIKKYNSEESLKKCEEIWKKISDNTKSPDNLTPEEKESLTFCVRLSLFFVISLRNQDQDQLSLALC